MNSHDRRIPTTQAGSLPRPDRLIELNRARADHPARSTSGRIRTNLGRPVADVVLRQRELGLDVPGDGEYGKAMRQRVDYGAWWSYSFQRLGGLELGSFDLFRDSATARGRCSRPVPVPLA